MAINIDAIRNKLNKLQNTQKKSDLVWKPEIGVQQIRIVPYKFRPDNPFIELYFHYNLNNKTYLSPISFGDPDPINEFAEKLKNTGSKEDWKAGKNMEPKLRTYVPVVVRGKEHEGVKFWGFGKTVYQELLAYIADPDYGDITDPIRGRDITVEYTAAKEAGASFPTTAIRVKPNQTPITDDVALAKKLMEAQSEITDLYSVLTYDELKTVLENWLNAETGDAETTQPAPAATTAEPEVETPKTIEPVKETPSTSDSKLDEVEAAFNKMFNK